MADTIELRKSETGNLNALVGYGFDDRYIATRLGGVYLIVSDDDTTITCKKMSPFKTRDGYIEYVLTYPNGIKKHIQEQRIIAGLFVPRVPGKEYVNHKNGIRDDNRAFNLEWTTASENIQHSFDVLGKTVWNSNKKK